MHHQGEPSEEEQQWKDPSPITPFFLLLSKRKKREFVISRKTIKRRGFLFLLALLSLSGGKRNGPLPTNRVESQPTHFSYSLLAFASLREKAPLFLSFTYHDCAIVGVRPGHGHVQVEAIFALRRVRVPHFRAGKPGEHRVDDLHASVGPFRGVSDAGPTFGLNRRPEASISYGRLCERDAPEHVDVFSTGAFRP